MRELILSGVLPFGYDMPSYKEAAKLGVPYRHYYSLLSRLKSEDLVEGAGNNGSHVCYRASVSATQPSAASGRLFIELTDFEAQTVLRVAEMFAQTSWFRLRGQEHSGLTRVIEKLKTELRNKSVKKVRG